MNRIYKLLAIVGAIVLIACTKQHNPIPPTVTEEIKYDLEDKLIPTVYYTAGSSVQPFREIMQLRSAVTAASAE